MGWSFGYSSSADVRRSIQADCAPPNKIVRQAATCYGRHLWTLYELGDGTRTIVLDLIEKSGLDWGYKAMDEGMHPFYYDCPLVLLTEAGPTTNKDALAWREKVREFHSQSTREYHAGDAVTVYGKRYEVISKVKRSYHVRSLDDGRTYRVSPAKMTSAEAQATVVEESHGL